MSTRHLFLPFLIALAGIVSCNQLLPDDQQGTPRGYVTVDKQHYCNLTNVKGKDFEGSQKWVFNDGDDIRVKMSGWRCRCGEPNQLQRFLGGTRPSRSRHNVHPSGAHRRGSLCERQ